MSPTPQPDIFVFMYVKWDGERGILGFPGRSGVPMPMMTQDPETVTELKKIAKILSSDHKIKVELVRFVEARVVEIIDENPSKANT